MVIRGKIFSTQIHTKKMINKVTLLGNVGKDPEIKTTTTGKKVATFSLATTEKYGDNSKTSWHSIVVWEKLAEICEKYVKKGSQIFIEGKISYRDYTDKNGVKHNITEVVAHEIKLLGGRPAETQQEPKAHSREDILNASDDSNNLPF